MISGLQWALDHGIMNVVLAEDSRIAIQQLNGSIQCHKPALKVLLAEALSIAAKMSRVKYSHVVRIYNKSADYLATDALTHPRGRIVEDPEEIQRISLVNRLQITLYEKFDETPPVGEHPGLSGDINDEKLR